MQLEDNNKKVNRCLFAVTALKCCQPTVATYNNWLLSLSLMRRRPSARPALFTAPNNPKSRTYADHFACVRLLTLVVLMLPPFLTANNRRQSTIRNTLWVLKLQLAAIFRATSKALCRNADNDGERTAANDNRPTANGQRRSAVGSRQSAVTTRSYMATAIAIAMAKAKAKATTAAAQICAANLMCRHVYRANEVDNTRISALKCRPAPAAPLPTQPKVPKGRCGCRE